MGGHMTKAIYSEYIPNLIDSMLSNLHTSDHSFLLIKHYNTFDLTAEYVDSLAKERPDTLFLYHSFDSSSMISAYEPILGWIKSFFYEQSALSMDDFFDACNVYPLHRSVFRSYFTKGICSREEEPLLNEIAFEQKRFVAELTRMLHYLSDNRPMLLVFNRLHSAGASTLSVITELLSNENIQNIAVLATYNEVAPEIPYLQTELQTLRKFFSKHNCVLDWSVYSEDDKIEDTNTGFLFDSQHISEYCVQLINMYHTLALSQADYYLDIIYRKLEVEKIYILPEYRFALLELYAQTALYQDKSSDALLYCHMQGSLIENTSHTSWGFRHHFLEGQIHMYSCQQDSAARHIAECRALLPELDNPFLAFRVDMLDYMNAFNGWRNIWVFNSDYKQHTSIVDQALKYNYLNHAAHIYVYSFDNDVSHYKDINNLDVSLPYFTKGIQLAEKLGNNQFLIEAYTKNVLTASTNGYYDVANYFNERCFTVVKQENNRREEACIYNSMGYNCCTMEKYTEANEYYHQALLIFSDLNDIDAANETIYNLAINALLAEEFAIADNYFGTCLNIIKSTRANSVRVCNISKIYGLKAYCGYRLGIFYSCRLNIQFVKQFLGHIIELEEQDRCEAHLWDDDLFLYYFINGLLLDHEGEPEEALLMMRKARKYMERSTGSTFLNLPLYAIGYSRIAKSTGYPQEADEILHTALSFCEQKGYLHKKDQIVSEMEGREYSGRKWELPLKDIELDTIKDKAVQAGIAKNYEEQKNEINFLGIWQKMVNNTDTPIHTMTEHAITTFMNNYNMDDFIFIRIEDARPVLNYCDCNYEINNAKIKYLTDYFNTNRNAFVTTRLDKRYAEYKAFIQEVFGFNSINTLICIPLFSNEELNSIFICGVEINMEWNYKSKRFDFNQDDVSIFIMLFRQLLNAITRMEAQSKIEHINKELQFVNSRLKQMAVRDSLTGLYNRQGFNEELEMELHRASAEHRSIHLALLYADLDNFKYYNDTFGHEIGDLILREFSNLIKKICANRGYAIRYGGDEFIMLLYSDDHDEVEQAAKDIYAGLERQQGFTQKIAYTLKKQISIPKEKYVSCSIGISMNTLDSGAALKEQMETTLRHADEMMYHVKKTTKHRYAFFE